MDFLQLFKYGDAKKNTLMGEPLPATFKRDILSQIDDFVWCLNPQGEFEYLSPSVILTLGCPDTDLTFEVFRKLVIPQSLPVFEHEIALLKNHNGYSGPRNWTIGIYNHQKQVIWLETVSSLVFTENQKIGGMVACSRNVTERHNREQQVAQHH